MAIVHVVEPHIHPGAGRGTYAHLRHAIQYILKPEKTLGGLYTASLNCRCETALKEMIETKRQYGKEPDPQSQGYEHDRLGYHIVISWSPKEGVSPETAMEITRQFCEKYLPDYEAVYSSHLDTEHMHTHIVFNSVNYKTGRKYHFPADEWERNIQPLMDQLCKEQGLHTLEEDTGKSIAEYAKERQEEKRRKKTKRGRKAHGNYNYQKEGIEDYSISDYIRDDIDMLIASSESFEEFEEKLMPAAQTGGRTSFKLGWLFDLNQTNLSEEKKQELLQSRKNILPESVNAAQISELIKNIIKVDETPPEDRLQKEISQYLLYLQYGLSVAGIRFDGLAMEEIRSLTITDKRKVLREAFRLTECYKEEVEQKLDEMQKNPLLEEKGFPGYIGQAEAITTDNMPTPSYDQEKEAAMNETPDLPADQTEKGKIEDFGRKIGGARKDVWRGRGLRIEDLAEMNEAEAVKYVIKDNIWNKPDYLQMIQDGTPVRVAYFIKEVRNALPAKVTYSSLNTTPEQIRKRQEDYISLIGDVKERLLKIRDDDGIRSFFDEFVNDEVYVKRVTSYMVSRTEKGFDVTNKLLKAMQVRDMLIQDRKIQQEQFGVDAAHKLPKGYRIRYLKEQNEYIVIKNYHVLKDGLKSEAEAIEAAKELQKSSVASRKQRFLPVQLEHVRREGPSNGITQENPATGDMYMASFGFSGGEFGNWLNEQERQAFLNMGYDAFMDLAAALSIAPEEIALDNRLAIAFGSRGRGGKAAAAAHYEPMLEVINLTKMKGAGSLAHEWGHAFDDIMGKKLGMDGFMTKNIRDKRVPESVRQLMEAMKKRPATEEERQKRNDRLVGRAKRDVEQLCRRMLPEERMNESEREAWSRLLQEIAAKAEERGSSGETEEMNGIRIKWIDEKVSELAMFQKSVSGHAPNKEARDQLYYAIDQFESSFIACQGEMMVQTEFYSNSVKFDSMYSKESKGYWHSDEEMFVRAFACYVHDRLPWRSDYLCGHSESAVAFDTTKEETVLIKAIPEGEERKRINRCFDRVFDEFRGLGLLKGVEGIEYQPRESIEQTVELQAAAGMEMSLRRKGRGR